MADPSQQCWWEQAAWPVGEGDELGSDWFEDIRKRIFLLRGGANVTDNIYRLYGRQIGTGEYVAYDQASWSATNWPSYSNPGALKRIFKDDQGIEDLYVNWAAMSGGDVKTNPPVRSDGALNYAWRLGPWPGRYHHFDRNAGKPAIGADHRWVIGHHGDSDQCPLINPYTFRSEVYHYLPRQLDPTRQIAPIKRTGSQEVVERCSHVEAEKDCITRSIGTVHARTMDTEDLDFCIRPRRLSEYVREFGEPDTGICNGSEQSECDLSNQCAMDPKLSEAYQDQVIKTAEDNGSVYLKAVDERWIENWLWAQDIELWVVEWSYSAGAIVYTDAADDVFYVALVNHSSTADTKPGDGVDWEDKWMLGTYQPEPVRNQPVYVELAGTVSVSPGLTNSWFWGCNDSAYELLLRDLAGPDQFDWWFDKSFPAVPIWLYKKQFDPDRNDWPLPRGCWRRTWKHSMGRVGSMMWPGEKGDPPGYDAMKLIVTQTVYNQMPEASRRWYTVSDVEGLHTQAYGAEEEDLVAKRHDPVQTVRKRWYDKRRGCYRWASHPMWELHHDLVNDLRNVLLQLYLVGESGLTIHPYTYSFRGIDDLEGDSSLQAYAIGRASTVQERGAPNTNPVSTLCESDQAYGYWVRIEHWTDGVDYYSTGETFERRQFYLHIAKAAGASHALDISSALVRIGYWGDDNDPGGDEGRWDGCEVGFEGLTLFADPTDGEKNAYIRLPLRAGSSDTEWYFDTLINSPWPATEGGGFFDFSDEDIWGFYSRRWRRLTQCHIEGDDMDRWCVFEMDWDLVPAEVFAEDTTNAIEVA